MLTCWVSFPWWVGETTREIGKLNPASRRLDDNRKNSDEGNGKKKSMWKTLFDLYEGVNWKNDPARTATHRMTKERNIDHQGYDDDWIIVQIHTRSIQYSLTISLCNDWKGVYENWLDMKMFHYLQNGLLINCSTTDLKILYKARGRCNIDCIKNSL